MLHLLFHSNLKSSVREFCPSLKNTKSRKHCSWPPGAIKKLNCPAALLLTFRDIFALYYCSTGPILLLTFPDVSTIIILPYTSIKFFVYSPPYTTILPCMLIQELRIITIEIQVAFVEYVEFQTRIVWNSLKIHSSRCEVYDWDIVSNGGKTITTYCN